MRPLFVAGAQADGCREGPAGGVAAQAEVLGDAAICLTVFGRPDDGVIAVVEPFGITVLRREAIVGRDDQHVTVGGEIAVDVIVYIHIVHCPAAAVEEYHCLIWPVSLRFVDTDRKAVTVGGNEQIFRRNTHQCGKTEDLSPFLRQQCDRFKILPDPAFCRMLHIQIGTDVAAHINDRVGCSLSVLWFKQFSIITGHVTFLSSDIFSE